MTVADRERKYVVGWARKAGEDPGPGRRGWKVSSREHVTKPRFIACGYVSLPPHWNCEQGIQNLNYKAFKVVFIFIEKIWESESKGSSKDTAQ